MRGKTATPFTRIGAESSTVGVPGGRGLEVGGDVGCVGVAPGGSDGGRTNGIRRRPSRCLPRRPGRKRERRSRRSSQARGRCETSRAPPPSCRSASARRRGTCTPCSVRGGESRPRRELARAAVVGDQIPKRSSTPTSRTTRAASGTRHFTTAENGYVSTETTSGAGVLVAFAPLDASTPNALGASRERAAQRRSMGGTRQAGVALASLERGTPRPHETRPGV